MKKLLPYFLLLFLFFTVNAGFDIAPQETFRPVFMLRSEVERSITLGSPQSIKNPGKIYLKNHLIFINEKFRGIHVIDNSDPENPQKRAFIQVDGCIDIAMKDNVMYADNAVDLIAFKFDESAGSLEVVKRIKGVFPEPLSPDGRGVSWAERQAVPDDAVLVRWERNNKNRYESESESGIR